MDAIDEMGYAVPSVRHLKELLQAVADPANAEERTARGARAAHDMATRFHPTRTTEPIRARLDELSARLPSEPAGPV